MKMPSLFFSSFMEGINNTINTTEATDRISLGNDMIQTSAGIFTLASTEADMRTVTVRETTRVMKPNQSRTKAIFLDKYNESPKNILEKELIMEGIDKQTLVQSDFSKFDTTIRPVDTFFLLTLYAALVDNLDDFLPLAEMTLNEWYVSLKMIRGYGLLQFKPSLASGHPLTSEGGGTIHGAVAYQAIQQSTGVAGHQLYEN